MQIFPPKKGTSLPKFGFGGKTHLDADIDAKSKMPGARKPDMNFDAKATANVDAKGTIPKTGGAFSSKPNLNVSANVNVHQPKQLPSAGMSIKSKGPGGHGDLDTQIDAVFADIGGDFADLDFGVDLDELAGSNYNAKIGSGAQVGIKSPTTPKSGTGLHLPKVNGNASTDVSVSGAIKSGFGVHKPIVNPSPAKAGADYEANTLDALGVSINDLMNELQMNDINIDDIIGDLQGVPITPKGISTYDMLSTFNANAELEAEAKLRDLRQNNWEEDSTGMPRIKGASFSFREEGGQGMAGLGVSGGGNVGVKTGVEVRMGGIDLEGDRESPRKTGFKFPKKNKK